MSDDHKEVHEVAAGYVRVHGTDAVEYLTEEAERAENLGDSEAARTWREIAAAAARIVGDDRA
jgi:hypothetical protein